MPVRDIMTAAEAAEYLQVHIKTLYEWIKSGDLAVVKLGPRSTRIRKVDIDRFLNARVTGPSDSSVAEPGEPSAERSIADAKAAAPSTATRDVKRRVIK
jgi:excisionase family DNA binding protein